MLQVCRPFQFKESKDEGCNYYCYDLLKLAMFSFFVVVWYSLFSPTQSSSWNVTQVDHELKSDAPFGKFRCILRSYEPFTEVEVTWPQINTPWQQGWTFSGVPEINNAKTKILITCERMINFEAGFYSFFLYSRGFHSSIKVAGTRFGMGPEEAHEKGNIAQGVITQKIEIINPATELLEFTAVKFDGQEKGLGDIMVTWNKIEPTVSDLQATTNLFFHNWPKPYDCESIMKIPGSSWSLCEDQVKLPEPGCLVYSVGISYIYYFDTYIGQQGCEVFSFDCTVSYDTNLAENVRFYPYCLSDRDYVGPEGRIFKTFQTIQKEFGHQGRKLKVFKIDCEGCEYEVFPNLSEQELDLIDSLQLEAHLGLKIYPETLDVIAETYRKIERHFRPYHFNINRGQNPYVEVSQELMDAGFLNHMCCVEYGFVNRKFFTPS